jgi:hypothetical protein
VTNHVDRDDAVTLFELRPKFVNSSAPPPGFVTFFGLSRSLAGTGSSAHRSYSTQVVRTLG